MQVSNLLGLKVFMMEKHKFSYDNFPNPNFVEMTYINEPQTSNNKRVVMGNLKSFSIRNPFYVKKKYLVPRFSCSCDTEDVVLKYLVAPRGWEPRVC